MIPDLTLRLWNLALRSLLVMISNICGPMGIWVKGCYRTSLWWRVCWFLCVLFYHAGLGFGNADSQIVITKFIYW